MCILCILRRYIIYAYAGMYMAKKNVSQIKISLRRDVQLQTGDKESLVVKCKKYHFAK